MNLNLCVDSNKTIKEVMELIELYRERGVIIVESDKVCGVLTLGNIITALSEGKTIFSKISNIYTTNFIYLNSFDYKKAFEIFKKKNLSFIPIIDKEYHLLGIITPRDIMDRVRFEE